VADSDHPKRPPAPRKPRDLRSLHSELGPAWEPPEQPRRSRSRPNTSSEGLLASNHSTFGSEVKTFKRPDIAPTHYFHSPQYPGGWPHSAEKLAEANIKFGDMPPKQPAEAPARVDQADLLAMIQQNNTMLEQMSKSLADNLKLTNSIIPRLEAIESARSRPASPDPGCQSPAPQSYAPQSQVPQSYAPQSQAPQSYAPQSVGSADFQPLRHSDDNYKRPRFRPETLPAIRYGEDIELWLAEMDNAVLQHGEEIVCPEIFANCFQPGDPIKVWYLGTGPDFRRIMTTKPGCWDRFKDVMSTRFSVDISMRQLAAEDRIRLPGEAYAAFALQKISLIQRAFGHMGPGAIIAMVKRKLDPAAASFCREKDGIDKFVAELTDYDNLQAILTVQRQPQASRMTQRAYGQPQMYGPTYAYGSPPYGQLYAYGQPTPSTQAYAPPAHQSSRRQTSQYPQQSVNAPPATANDAPAFVDPRLPTVQPRKHPQTGVDTLSYLDRSGRTVFIQRPCGHCAAAGKANVWHFEFSCANKPQAPKRAKTYAGVTDLPGTVESPSGLPTSYTFSGYADDPGDETNPFSIDDCESGNGAWDQ
jgi:hypothetical protein